METNENVKYFDLSKLLLGLEGMWVVLSEDKSRVIASGKTLDEIADKAQEGSIMKVPRFDTAYAPAS